MRRLASRRPRSELATRLAFRHSIHQDNSHSALDRYPRLFGLVRDALAGRSAPCILSFGCAAGEEVVSLQDYIPDAEIVGAEINRALLRACRRLPPDPRRTFIASSRDNIAGHGPYDAIFCMAVFTRRPHEVEARGLHDIARFYPYALFEAEVCFLASQVRAGGFLIVEHALYLVEDALVGLPYEPAGGVGPAKGPRFSPAGKLLDAQPVIARIFRRTA